MNNVTVRVQDANGSIVEAPAIVSRTRTDHAWGHRESRTIRLEMDSATAAALFVDDAIWGVAEEDLSDFCMAGSIVDNRDGTVTVKMGKPTEAELLAIIMGGKSV